MNKCYSVLNKITSFRDRLRYLQDVKRIGEETFGSYRYLNQRFYSSIIWRDVRRNVILRDNGCDLAHPDYPISGKIYVHHINPITPQDILDENPIVLDLENLVCASFGTHNKIHFGEKEEPIFTIRTENDTCPWKE